MAEEVAGPAGAGAETAAAGQAEAGAATAAVEPNPNSPWVTLEGMVESWRKEMGIVSFFFT
jgi:hypothetical protein